MAITIQTPAASFVRFDSTGIVDHCIFDNIRFCLPVIDEDDVAFQFFLNGSKAEIDSMCGPYGTPVELALVENNSPTVIMTFSNLPEIFRLSDTQLLVNWQYGFPDFDSNVDIDECFRVRVEINGLFFYSNCFTRIEEDDCFTSRLEYWNDENAFGFNYCNGGEVDGDGTGGSDDSCENTTVTFPLSLTVNIPYTTQLQDKYGPMPNVKVWIYDTDGTLIDPLLQVKLNGYPPTTISVDLGGPASGVVVIS